MNLNEEDAKRFYNIWFKLLDYTNIKFNIVPDLNKLSHSTGINPKEISPIRDRLWLDNTVIDEVVDSNCLQFSETDLALVSSWRNCVSDKFILLKHLKKYSIFMGNKNIYGATGIVSPFEEMFPSFALPLMVQTVLIPFEGRIIYDSLIAPFNIKFGGGAKKGFQDEYRELKSTKGIILTLE